MTPDYTYGHTVTKSMQDYLTTAGWTTVTNQVAPLGAPDYSSYLLNVANSGAEVLINVNKAPLTITASSHTITFNAPVPTITPGYSGFVNGDDPTDLTAPTCSTTYTVGSLVGTYPSKCENAISNNYNFTYVDGVVTVVTACSVFNGFLPPIGGSVESGKQGADSVYSLAQTR